MDREFAIKLVNDTIKEAGLNLEDIDIFKPTIKHFNSLQTNYRTVCGIVEHTIYPKFVDEMGEKEAYEWFCDNISSEFRTDFNIPSPRRYKVVNCSITCSVAVPIGFEDSDVQDVVSNLDLLHNGDWYFETDNEDVSENDLGHFDYINDAEDFSDGDFV